MSTEAGRDWRKPEWPKSEDWPAYPRPFPIHRTLAGMGAYILGIATPWLFLASIILWDGQWFAAGVWSLVTALVMSAVWRPGADD